MTTLYRYDGDGYYTDTIENDNPRVFYPRTTTVAPVFEEGCRPRWNGSAWISEPLPSPPPAPEPAQPTEREILEEEMDTLKQYLRDTDYCVIKCLETGLDIVNEYPSEVLKRSQARARINEIEELMKEMEE